MADADPAWLRRSSPRSTHAAADEVATWMRRGILVSVPPHRQGDITVVGLPHTVCGIGTNAFSGCGRLS
jgi:hypothetical protein